MSYLFIQKTGPQCGTPSLLPPFFVIKMASGLEKSLSAGNEEALRFRDSRYYHALPCRLRLTGDYVRYKYFGRLHFSFPPLGHLSEEVAFLAQVLVRIKPSF